MPRSDRNAIRRVSEPDVERLADRVGLQLSPEEVADYRALVNGALEGLDAVAEHRGVELLDEGAAYTDRPPGRPPSPGDDRLNAWITRCRVEGAPDGPLAGVTVGLKDSIALAGYPMTAGSEVLSGFAPTIDATVATRLLDAGATIVGKQNMESFAFSGSGDTSDFGPVVNPHSEDHLAGGSSSGSAAAVAAGDCDVSIGTDQLGSIRIPSAICGVVGIKPTSGLVPYTGVVPLEPGIDHVGPFARTVEPVAETLEVVAGEDVRDGLHIDPRQPRGVEAGDYTSGLDDGVSDLTLGVLAEGFGWEFSEPEVDDAVEDAVDVLAGEGATVREVSMDLHRTGMAAAGVVAFQGSIRTFQDAGVGTGYTGWYWTELADALDAFLEARTDRLPPSVKQGLLAAEHLRDVRGVSLYAAAKNMALELERGYDRLLAECDALLMPTVPVRAFERDDDLDRVTATSREFPSVANTSPMDMTGHPAISVPCAKPDGLPVGLMVVGSHFDEATVLRVARAFEAATDWESR